MAPTDIHRIDSKLDRVLNQQEAILTQQGSIVTKLERHLGECEARWKQQDEDHAEIHGSDGKAGIKADVQELKTVSGIRSKVIWAVVGGIMAIVGWVAEKCFGG
jgi:hypothetical protein